jgi:hypothetical protein
MGSLSLRAAATATIAALLTSSLAPAHAPARSGDDPHLVWRTVVPVTRKSKPGRKWRRRPKEVEDVPLLTLKWRVLEREAGGGQREAGADERFTTGDQLRLGFTVNQDGFLYILQHSEGAPGPSHVLFPAPGVNEGLNLVKADREYFVPGHCTHVRDPRDCWLELTPPAGREVLVVIFSRDEITDLPSRASGGSVAEVQAAVVAGLRDGSGQQLHHPGRSAGGKGHGVLAANLNRNDNEELIETIVLEHQ